MFRKDDFLGDSSSSPKPTRSDSKNVETLIGPSVKVEGDFNGDGDVVVEGIVTGKLKTKRNLRIGKNAQVLASISAENALVSGIIQGNIKIREKLELTPTARIKGDIQAKILIISEGASFTGNCKMLENVETEGDLEKEEKPMGDLEKEAREEKGKHKKNKK